MEHAFKPWSFLNDKSALLRLSVGTVFAVTFGLTYLWFFQYSNIVWKDQASATTMFLLLNMCVLDWSYWWTLSMDNWPFSLWVPQPLQGLLVAICSVLLGFGTLLIFDKIGWHAHIFPLGVWTMLFLLMLPAWTGKGFIREAYEGKQPITGISTGITALGLATICWWFTLAVTTKDIMPNIAGVPIGMPFVWFGGAVTFAFAMGMWPFQVKQPQQLVMLIGYMAVYSVAYLGLMNALKMDWFIGPPMHGTLYTLVWMLPALYWIGLGQSWPLHAARPWVRGLIIVGGSMLICWFIFAEIILPQSSTGAMADWTSGAHAVRMMLNVNWALGLFVGWVAIWCNMGWLFLPPPK